MGGVLLRGEIPTLELGLEGTFAGQVMVSIDEVHRIHSTVDDQYAVIDTVVGRGVLTWEQTDVPASCIP